MLDLFRGRGGKTAVIWWLVVISSAVVFVFGFSVAPSLVGGGPVSESAVIGEVDGLPITNGEYQQAVQQAIDNFRLQQGRDVAEHEFGFVRDQAWLQLVTEKAVLAEAKRLGIKASDAEVVYTIKNTPPQYIRQIEAFQTNGQFDFGKYQQALSNPNNDWSGVEEEIRRVLPAQKFQEMLMAMGRFSEPELRRAYHEQYDSAKVTLALWIPPTGPMDTTAVAEEELRRFYDEHPRYFTGPTQVRAELVTVTKLTTPEDQQSAERQIRSLRDQAVSGADFSQLARDMSQDQLAGRGGDMGVVPAAQIPPNLREPITALGDSGITEPVLERGRYYLYKAVLDPTAPEPSYHLWQISIPVEQSPETFAEDMERLERLRKAARSSSLGEASARLGYAAQELGWFGLTDFVPLLNPYPHVQQHALIQEAGEVSPVWDTQTGWLLIQTTERREAGRYPYEAVAGQIEQVYRRHQGLDAARQAAARATQAIESGEDFLLTASQEGANQTRVTDFFTRRAPDGLLGGSPRAIGLAFSLEPGQVAGPIEGRNGIYVIRKEEGYVAPEEEYDALKGQISETLLSFRQQRNFESWLVWYRDQSNIEDKRAEILPPL